jgi:transcriptional regulator with XRE-family HTH domain
MLHTRHSRVSAVDSSRTEKLPDYIRRIRAEKGLSTADVEKKSGFTVTDGYVSHIENGRVKNVSPEKLRALAKGLGVSEDEIFAIVRGANKVGDMPLDEVRMLQFYRELPPDRKEDVLAHLELACKRHGGGGNRRRGSLIPPGGRRMPDVTKGIEASGEQEKKRA